MRALPALLLIAACKAEPPPHEKLQATPDKSQPAIAVTPFAPPQQVRPEQETLEPLGENAQRADGKVDPNDFLMHDDRTWKQSSGWALEDRPGSIEMVETHQGTLLRGRAKNHEAIAELMRSMTGLVQTPDLGLARVVERRAGSSVVRVVVLTESNRVLEYLVSEVPPLKVELLKAEPQKDGQVLFEVLLKRK